MKTAWSCLLTALVASTGCVALPTLKEGPPPPPPQVIPAPYDSAEQGVSANQVTDANAHEKAEQLKLELLREGP